MAVLRCANCGKPNPDFLDICQFCDQPLRGEGAPAAAESAPAEPVEAIPDWLRGEAAAEPEAAPPQRQEQDWMWKGTGGEAEQPAASAEDVPDWLRAMQGESPAPAADEPSSAAIPDWLSGGAASDPFAAPAESAAAMPDWLTGGTSAEPAAPAPSPAASDIPDWLRGMGEPSTEPSAFDAPASAAPASDVPDWMNSLGGAPAEPAPSFGTPATPAASDVPDWMNSLGGAPAEPVPSFGTPAAPAASDVPDWMSSLGGAPAEPAPSFGASAAPAASDVPDWMSSLGGAPAEPASPFGASAAPASDTPDWMSSLGGAPAEPASPFGASAAPASDTPDWMSSLGGAPAEPASPFGASVTPASDTPDWMSSLSGAPAEPAPSFADPSFEAPAEPGPSFAAPETAQPSWMSEAGTGSALAGETPSWLSAFRPSGSDATEGALPPAGATPFGASDEIAQTALPSWLAALKPASPDSPGGATEADTYQETVGLLAGVRGILRAEPLIAMPHKSNTEVHKLLVTDAHVAQADILAGFLKEDTETSPEAKRKARLSVPFERWLVMVLLIVAVIVPPLFTPGIFPVPRTINLATQKAFQIIDKLPNDKPALIAFDYDPAQSGELNPGAEALVSHLIRRGVPLIGVSALATGAGVGEEVLRHAAEGKYAYGTHYTNLGYILGGPVGLYLFAVAPRRAFQIDFQGTAQAWDQPLLASLWPPDAGRSLGDELSLIVLISATPEATRAWIEQTRALTAKVPMIAVVSAGAEPLVRPYYEGSYHEGEQPALNGLVTGVVGAAQYEQQAGVPGSASGLWDALGGGLVMLLVLFVAGNLIFGVVGFMRRRKR